MKYTTRKCIALDRVSFLFTSVLTSCSKAALENEAFVTLRDGVLSISPNFTCSKANYTIFDFGKSDYENKIIETQLFTSPVKIHHDFVRVSYHNFITIDHVDWVRNRGWQNTIKYTSTNSTKQRCYSEIREYFKKQETFRETIKHYLPWIW